MPLDIGSRTPHTTSMPATNPLTTNLIRVIREWATDNYERGGDVIVEAFTDAEIDTDILRDGDGKLVVTTEDQAIKAAARFCGLHEEQAANVLSQSGEHDTEAAAHMLNAEELSS